MANVTNEHSWATAAAAGGSALARKFTQQAPPPTTHFALKCFDPCESLSDELHLAAE